MENSTGAAPTPRMTHEAWLAEGRKRFGTDYDKWRFVCPICNHVAAIGDFRPFKDQGATPDSATNQCIGRFDGSTRKAFSSSKERGEGRCDYALFGLFRFPGVIIAMPDGKEQMAFAFADPNQE